MAELPTQREETLGGYIVHGVPFPVSSDPEGLAFLKKLAPIQIEQEYKITYLHSYGQDSPWFAGLTNKRLLASQAPGSGYTYAMPRGHDIVHRRRDQLDRYHHPSRRRSTPSRSATSARRNSCPRRPTCWRWSSSRASIRSCSRA